MASLPRDPKGWELEDFVAAHFASRQCYVETGVKERGPDELLELDIVWTDFRQSPEKSSPVEVKSGDWGLGDVFKLFGWTSYLGLPPGQFVHKEPCGRVAPQSLQHVERRTGTRFLHVPAPGSAEAAFASLGLPAPAAAELPELLRFSFWAQRRLLKSLSEAIRQDLCPQTARKAKEYHQLINDAVFFMPDVRERVRALVTAHFTHRQLGASAAYEIETRRAEFDAPPQTKTFEKALYAGHRFPIQACLYLEHRARLYILKAVVEYWLRRERGEFNKSTLQFSQLLIDLPDGQLTKAMAEGAEKLSAAASFRQFPVFWQVLLWSWGGVLRTDNEQEEFAQLSIETGVPVEEIPLALSAFDQLFPTPGGWFRQPGGGDSRSVLLLMPAAIRGIGSYRRLLFAKVNEYSKIGIAEVSAQRMQSDHNTGARLLDSEDGSLVK